MQLHFIMKWTFSCLKKVGLRISRKNIQVNSGTIYNVNETIKDNKLVYTFFLKSLLIGPPLGAHPLPCWSSNPEYETSIKQRRELFPCSSWKKGLTFYRAGKGCHIYF